MGLTLRNKDYSEGTISAVKEQAAQSVGILRARGWSPVDLFRNNEQGAWYDPSDFSTLYQDSAGTTPVTALGQPVGLMLDKSKGAPGARGPELVTNGTFDSGTTTGWTPLFSTIAVVSSRLEITHTAFSGAYTDVPTISGKHYEVTWNYTPGTVNAQAVYLNSGTGTSTGDLGIISPNSGRAIFTATASNMRMYLRSTSAGTTYWDNISVREIPGNHASQATAAARPTVQARVNLLERTESIGGVGWSEFGVTAQDNQDIAPDGTTTGTRITTSVGSAQNIVRQINLPEWDNNTTASIYAKQIDCRYLAISGTASGTLANLVYAVFDLVDGDVETTQNCTAVMQAVGNGWFRCTLSKTADAATAQAQFVIAPWETIPAASPTVPYTATGKSLSVWHPQLERNGSATTYQRVTTATDYADIGLPRYLEFDGVDDAMATQSVDFSSTDEMTVCAGVYKATTTSGIVAELGIGTGDGVLFLGLGASSANQDAFVSKGTSSVIVRSGSNTAPRLDVWSTKSDISTPIAELRANGSLLASASTTQGTGNYGDHTLNIGARDNGASNEFNGRIHQLIIRGATTSGNLLDQTERFVARKTGVTL